MRRQKNIIKGADVKACGHAAMGRPIEESERPTIVLHRTMDVVDAIEVTCPCGHTMVIECHYEENGSPIQEEQI